MDGKKDFGFDNGHVLEPGTTPPPGYVPVYSDDSGQQLVMPQQTIDDQIREYSKNVVRNRLNSSREDVGGFISGPASSKPMDTAILPSSVKGPDRVVKPLDLTNMHTPGEIVAGASAVLLSAGVSKIADSTNTSTGVDFTGSPVYSNTALANDKSTEQGSNLAVNLGMTIGAIGGFSDFAEAQNFMRIAEKSGDTALHSQLDEAKTSKNADAFIDLLGNGKNDQSKFTAFKLFENWNNMSPAQKAIAITTSGAQSFVFKDGTIPKTKKVTPEIPGVPSMTLATGMELSDAGINVAPVTRKWNQYSAIQETLYKPTKSSAVAESAASMGLIGYGLEGSAAVMNAEQRAQYDIVPAPHYGVGAATSPIGQGPPVGYQIVKTLSDRNVIVPKENADSVVLDTPDVASDVAFTIYNTWKKDGIKQDKGIDGGSALVGGLHKMEGTNPYSLGAVTGLSTYENVGANKNVSNLGYVTQITGVALQRLLKGEATKDTDAKGVAMGMEGEATPETFKTAMKTMRSQYAQNGISSREIGYQLSNQAYSEGRLNESQLVATQKALNMVFNDDGHILAQRLLTGKAAGIDLTERRRG